MPATLISMDQEQARRERIWTELFEQLDESYTVFHNYPLRYNYDKQNDFQYQWIPWIVFHNRDFNYVIPDENLGDDIRFFNDYNKYIDKIFQQRIPEYRNRANNRNERRIFNKSGILFCFSRETLYNRIDQKRDRNNRIFCHATSDLISFCNYFSQNCLDDEELGRYVDCFRIILHDIYTKNIRDNASSLNKQQTAILTGRRHRILGVAGSGKTLMLVKKAAISVSEGKSVLVVVFNNTLETHLSDRIDLKLGNNENNVKFIVPDVLTIDSLLLRNHPDYNTIKKQHPDKKRILEWYEESAINIIQHPEIIKRKYDVILVDEAQDFSEIKFEALSKFWKNDDHSEVVIVGDVMQDINCCSQPVPNSRTKRPSVRGFGFSGGWEIWKQSYRSKVKLNDIFSSFAKRFHLSEVFEEKSEDSNPGQGELFSTEYQTGEPVLSLPVGDYYCYYPCNKNTIYDKAVSLIGKLAGDNGIYNDDFGSIAILSDKINDLIEIKRIINERHQGWRVLSSFSDDQKQDRITKREFGVFVSQNKDLCLSTISSFKGLEKDTIILIVSGMIIADEMKDCSIIYSGITRARKRLIVLLNENADSAEFRVFFKEKQKRLLSDFNSMTASYYSNIKELLEMNKEKWNCISLEVGGGAANNDYSSLIDRIYYAYMFFPRYVYEYFISFKSLFARKRFQIRQKGNVSVLSVGCGPAPDLFAIQSLLNSDDLEGIKIKYVGIDIAAWNEWDCDYKAGENGSRRIVFDSPVIDSSFHYGPEQGDVLEFLKQEEEFDFDIIHFPCSYIEIKKAENGEIGNEMMRLISDKIKKDTIIMISHANSSGRNPIDAEQLYFKQFFGAVNGFELERNDDEEFKRIVRANTGELPGFAQNPQLRITKRIPLGFEKTTVNMRVSVFVVSPFPC